MPKFFVFILFSFINLISLLAPAAVDKKAVVFTKEVKAQASSDRLQYPARVRSLINAWVQSENAGEIKTIIKPIGSFVKKGETVLVLQNTDPVFNYAPVKISSPATGVVTSMEVSLLSRVDRGQKLFLITDPKQLVVDAEIPSADLKYFSVGQQGAMKDTQNNTYTIKVKALSPLVDIATGTAGAELEIIPTSNLPGHLPEKTAATLNPGQLGTVVFEVNKRNSIIVPESALIYREGKPFVRVVENGQAKRLPIRITNQLTDSVEIAEGLREGQMLITRWSRFIGDNEDVEAQNLDAQNNSQKTENK